MAIILGIVTYISGYASSIVHNREIRDASTIAMFFLWAWVGFLLSAKSNAPMLVKHAVRLEHGLVFENMVYAIDPNADVSRAMQVGLHLRNNSGTALIWEVERCDIKIKTRHVSSEDNDNKGGLIPFGALRSYWAPAYPKSEIEDFLNSSTEATVDFAVIYGPYDEERRRRMKMKIRLYLRLNENGLIAATDRIIDQSEEDV